MNRIYRTFDNNLNIKYKISLIKKQLIELKTHFNENKFQFFKEFKRNHRKKESNSFVTRNCKNYNKVENLFKFLLTNKNSFIFESVEKGKTRGRIYNYRTNSDKIWDINNNSIKINSLGKIRKIVTNPLNFLNKLIKDFKVIIQKQLPSMSSMLVGYFSYDVIRYLEKIPNKCKDDLQILDVRLSRPTNLIIYDNLKKKIHFIEKNVFSDASIRDYNDFYDSIFKKNLKHLKVMKI